MLPAEPCIRDRERMSVEIETSSTPFGRKARLGLSVLAGALAVHAGARAEERSAAELDGGFIAKHGQFVQGVSFAGYSMSGDFPGVTRAGGADAFISELGASGDGIAFSSYLGGSGNDRAQGVAVDAAGVVHVVGFTDSSNFPKLDSPQLALSGGSDAFVTHISTRQFAYSALVGDAATDKAVGVAVDGATKTFAVAGNTTSANFPTQGALYPARIGSQDAFVMRFSSQAPRPSPWGRLVGVRNAARRVGLRHLQSVTKGAR